jgi:polyisoprenoid-binding protein YceI
MSTVVESTPTPTVQSWSVWHIDPRHSLAEFSVRHIMLSRLRGRFTGVSGTIIDAAGDPKYSSVKAEIDVTTLITGDPQRDEHLRSPDFFDVANHPTMTFESRRVSGSREHFKVTGDLTIRGQTRDVTLDVTFKRAWNRSTQPVGCGLHGRDGNQSQRVRPELEYGPRGRRVPGWRSREDRNRSRGCERGAGVRRRLRASQDGNWNR